MHDDEPGDILRDAYRHIPGRAQPSELLWQRTRASLREQGLLRSPPRPRRALLAAGVLAAGMAGFLIGWGAGRADAPALPHPATPAAPDPFGAAQLVQETATTHVLAVETLLRSLPRGGSADVARAQEVTLAAGRAQAKALRLLIPRELQAEPAQTPATAQPVIWF